MRARLEAWYLKFWAWMSGSGTILWARLQALVYTVIAVLVTTDVSAHGIFTRHPEWLIYWNVVASVLSELIRKNGTDVVTRHVEVPDYGPVETVRLVSREQ